MNIHAPKEAVEFFAQFNFIGKTYLINGEKYMKVKLKHRNGNRVSYFYSFSLNIIAHNIKDFDIFS